MTEYCEHCVGVKVRDRLLDAENRCARCGQVTDVERRNVELDEYGARNQARLLADFRGRK